MSKASHTEIKLSLSREQLCNIAPVAVGVGFVTVAGFSTIAFFSLNIAITMLILASCVPAFWATCELYDSFREKLENYNHQGTYGLLVFVSCVTALIVAVSAGYYVDPVEAGLNLRMHGPEVLNVEGWATFCATFFFVVCAMSSAVGSLMLWACKKCGCHQG